MTVAVTADEQNAYISEMLKGDAVWLAVDKRAMDLVPPELRERVAKMANPVVQVFKAMYGLRRSVFDYEAGRDTRFADRGLTLIEGSKCMHSYTSKDGHVCFLGAAAQVLVTASTDALVAFPMP